MAADDMNTSGRRIDCYTQHRCKTSVRTSATHRHGFCTAEPSEPGPCRTPYPHLPQRHRPGAWCLSPSMCRTLLLLAAAVLLSQPCTATYDVNERIAAARAWLPDRLQLDKITIDGHDMQQLMGSFKDYTFMVPRQQLQKGQAYTGSSTRLRRVVQDMLHGKPIKMGIVGGSISWGHGMKRGIEDWFSVFTLSLGQLLPHANVTGRNGCIPGTPSSYMNMCLDLSLDEDVDLVFVEYALNDGAYNSIAANDNALVYERLLRKIMSRPHKPAVVLMQITCHGLAFPESNPGRNHFHVSSEDVYGALAQYYDLSWLSFRDATWRFGRLERGMALRYEDLMLGDFLHPSTLGHRLMADLALFHVREAMLDLALHPRSSEEHEMLAQQLPDPMYPGNHHSTSKACVHQEAFASVVTEHQGWQFINEGAAQNKSKWGYVSTEPGAKLKVVVNTTGLVAAGHSSLEQVAVYLAYLKSYQHMGSAFIRCIAGCRCEERWVDGHHALKESQLFLAELNATQAEECVIEVEVDSKSSSGEHKFKVSGVMMSQYDQNGHKEYNQIGDGAWGAAFHHASAVDPGGENPVSGDPDPFTVMAASPPPELDPNDGTG